MKLQTLSALVCSLYFATLSQSIAATTISNTETRDTVAVSTRDSTASTEASYWGLSATEWDRYTELMEGVRRRLSDPNISPIEVLGIHAETPAERRRYARLWARIMFEDTRRVLEFQRAYDMAVRQLHENQSIIDVSKIPREVTDLNESDRLLLFAKVECTVCDELIRRVVNQAHRVRSIDIYIVDVEEKNDRTIQAWAQRVGIDPMLVRGGRISLNYENGVLNRIKQNPQRFPHLIRDRAGQLDQMSLEALL